MVLATGHLGLNLAYLPLNHVSMATDNVKWPGIVQIIAGLVNLVAAIVLAHNHPSGDPTPSEADIKVTRDLIRAGQVLKIEVLDHVIVGPGQALSMAQKGWL